jgi:hypothetical protein
MFVRYFIELPYEAGDVERALAAGPERWLPAVAEQAHARGERLLADVGIGDDFRLAHTVEITVGSPARFPTKLVVPISWQPTGGRSVLPSMDADLEIAPLGGHGCQLAVSARYEPPLRALGKVLDQAVLHRIAEATVKDFLDRVGDAIRREMASGNDLREGVGG